MEWKRLEDARDTLDPSQKIQRIRREMRSGVFVLKEAKGGTEEKENLGRAMGSLCHPGHQLWDLPWE